MMAKILKEKDFDGRCIKCGCYFEYTFDDLEHVYNGSDGEIKSLAYNYVKCPKCGDHVLNIWHNGSVKK